jgi:hypothetical protein
MNIVTILIIILSWLLLASLSAHSGIDLEWYLTTDYVNPLEFTSFQIMYVLRNLADTYHMRAVILTLAIGIASSLSLYLLVTCLSKSRLYTSILLPYYIFIPPVFLGAESMYRQAIAQIFLILYFKSIYDLQSYSRPSHAKLLYSMLLLSLSLNSHKGIILLLPAVILAHFVLAIYSKYIHSSFFGLRKYLIKFRSLFTIFISFSTPLLLVLLNSIFGPLASVVFGSSTRASSSGMTFLYYTPFLLQVIISLLALVYLFRHPDNTPQSRFSIFINSFILFACTTALSIYANPEYFQRTYYFPLIFLCVQILLPGSPFKHRHIIYLFSAFSIVSLLLLFSPQYQYLMSPQ